MAQTSYTHTNDSNGSVGTSLPQAKPAAKKSQEAGKTALIGLLGGVASAVAFTVYQRLPNHQRDRVHDYARSVIAARLQEFRDGLNL